MAKIRGFKDFPTKIKGVLPEKQIMELMPPELVREFQAFVFEKNDKGVKIAACDIAGNRALQHFAKKRFGDKVEWFKADKEDIEFILENHQLSPQAFDFKAEITRLLRAGRHDHENVIKIVDQIIRYAIAEKASDVHLEAVRNEMVVRFRLDGMLHQVLAIPHDLQGATVARFKILANMKIDEYRRPQDGRIEPEDLPDISLRVSIMPTLHGEKVVLRVLDDTNKDLSIRNLGFSEAQEEVLRRNTEKPFGLIVTSGPTGSGKTTTLYALLNLLKKDDINISTLEDPVEYTLRGVNQIQVNPRFDLTFASGLRALLRQDPDVIMVGEIRDSETMIMAANAALTGHLVLTTIHTNDAPSAFTRFLEMKVEDFVVGSIVNLVIAQRLVRRICKNCAKSRLLDPVVVKKIRERKDIMQVLKKARKNVDALLRGKFLIGTGCEKCLNTGYQGRIGLFELLEMNKGIHDLVLEHAPAEKIKGAAAKSGFRDMISDGVSKILCGVTTFEEVLHATRSI